MSFQRINRYMSAMESDTSEPHPPPSVAVIERVAAAEGTTPLELATPLHETLDPDALDALVGSLSAGDKPSDWCIYVSYCEYQVRIEAGGTVELL